MLANWKRIYLIKDCNSFLNFAVKKNYELWIALSYYALEAVLEWCFAKGVLQKAIIKFSSSEAYNFIKKETLAQCFPVNFTKFLRTTFFTEHLWWLLLHITDQLVIYYMHLKYMKDLYSNKYISILEEFFQTRYHTSYNRKNESGLR